MKIVLLFCSNCSEYFKREALPEEIEMMIRANIDSWIKVFICDDCIKKLMIEETKDEPK